MRLTLTKIALSAAISTTVAAFTPPVVPSPFITASRSVTPCYSIGWTDLPRRRKEHPILVTRSTVQDESSSDSAKKEHPPETEDDEEKEELTFMEQPPTTPEEEPSLTSDDWQIVSQINALSSDVKLMSDMASEVLPNMHPRLLLKLRKAIDGTLLDEALSDEQVEKLRTVGGAVQSVLDDRLQDGRDMLETLLGCGEIRKLDGTIGRAVKDGKLDMAFFTVLNMNLRDAEYESSLRTDAEEESQEEEVEEGSPPKANRLQILQHIYTRCQEEIEKAVEPGVGLLNKLLRTDVPSIRSNQLLHYLGRQKNTITTPDGKEVELQGQGPALVPPEELVDAIANAVKQIRSVEATGGTDRTAAAGVVESCRQVAIEARVAIAELYGDDSEEFATFSDRLQPVFRPTTKKEYLGE